MLTTFELMFATVTTAGIGPFSSSGSFVLETETEMVLLIKAAPFVSCIARKIRNTQEVIFNVSPLYGSVWSGLVKPAVPGWDVFAPIVTVAPTFVTWCFHVVLT